MGKGNLMPQFKKDTFEILGNFQGPSNFGKQRDSLD